MTPDLTSAEGVRDYLSATPFAALEVLPLSGGTANFAYRIRLRDPPYTEWGNEVLTMVFKHAEPYVATIRDFKYSTERQVRILDNYLYFEY